MKLYVGNLPYSVDDAKLKELFESFGEVEEAKVIQDGHSGRSKGFGFVTINDDGAAKKAISEMNEKEVDGRQIKVNEAKPMDPDRPRPQRRSFGNRSGGFDNRSGGSNNRSGGRSFNRR